MHSSSAIQSTQKLFQQAIQLHQQGRLANAKAIYEGILKVQPQHAESLHLLGVIAMDTGNPTQAVDLIGQAIVIDPHQAVFYSNCGNALLKLAQFNQAIASYDKAISLKPDYANAYYNRGVGLKALNQTEEAVASYDAAIAYNPRSVLAFYNRAIALQVLKRFDAAIQSYDKAISLQPNFADAHTNRGNALKDLGRLAEARQSHDRAIALRPDYAEAYANRGTVFQDLKQFASALENFDKAIALKPKLAGVYYNRGVVLQAMDKLEPALSSYDKAIALEPTYIDAYINRAYVLQYMGRLEEAESCYDKVIAIDPENADAHTNRGNALKDQGKLEEAEDSYKRAFALKPSPRLAFLAGLMLPPIMGTKDAMTQSRVRFESNVERLLAEGCTLNDPINDSCSTNFHLAYHGLNDKDIQVKVARLYEQACPSLLYVAPHCERPPTVGRPKRIGFLSKFITKHSVALSFSRIVDGIAQNNEFDVTLLSNLDQGDKSLKEGYPNFGGEYVRLTENLDSARKQVAALELDVLVYLDIGMDPFSYFLAFARLARTQCVLGGHPVTTGISAMDYFVSTDASEIANAQEHYSEKLVRLATGLFYFERPKLPPTFKTRSELCLPIEGNIYLCPMMLHKLHPDFDEAMGRILELDPSGHVVLIADKKYSCWQRFLQKRFETTVPDGVRDRIIFLPWITEWNDFASLNKAADVILDPFHFGMGTTAITTCAVGTPFVTKPSQFMRGRVGLFFATLLDVPECVATDTEDYAQKAVAIASDIVLREKIRKKIHANDQLLFDNSQSIQCGVEFFSQIAETTF